MAATEPVRDFAPAKVNLTLHVTGQRSDGYHLLDSLVVFVGVGDDIEITPADTLSLTVDGPEAQALTGENLVLKAARHLDPSRGAAIRLTKRLPVASGIGGGSSDAAATLRALSRLWDLPLPSNVLALGADVPVCLAPHPVRMRGIGDRLDPVTDLPPLDILLVNPRVPVPTPEVFRRLTRRDNSPMPDLLLWTDARTFAAWLATQRNDLLEPALSIAPEIGDVLDALRQTNCLFAGMSGSGATCFALYPRGQEAAKAQASLPGQWWSGWGKML